MRKSGYLPNPPPDLQDIANTTSSSVSIAKFVSAEYLQTLAISSLRTDLEWRWIKYYPIRFHPYNEATFLVIEI